MIDFDRNATTPVTDSVREAMEPFLNGKYGNPSSLHQIGQTTKAAVEKAREQISESISADPESLILTSSGSEANTQALRGFITPPYNPDKTLIVSQTEHSCVLDTAKWLENQGITVKYAPLKSDGQIDMDWLEDSINSEINLVSIMSVNNETGVKYPIEEIGELCREHGVTFHTDAVQAYGKIPLSFEDAPVDMMTISAHKIGGPKGVGALFAPKTINLDPLIFGGHQERDRRGGTENVPAVVGFGQAASEIQSRTKSRVKKHRNFLEQFIEDNVRDLIIIGRNTERVGNTVGLLVQDVLGEDIIIRMDREGVALATGSACTSGTSQPSHVISAIPLPESYNPESFVRISLPKDSNRGIIKQVAEQLVDCIHQLRNDQFV